MQFSTELTSGTLVKRYKRFLADVALEDGTIITAHCPNTGAMTGCAEPGYKVWIRHSNDPKRKLAYSWELAIDHEQNMIGINTHNANNVVAEALAKRMMPEFARYKQFKREVRFGNENSKVDFVLSSDELADLYLEVKSVTLLQKGLGFFPDAETQRGQKHLRELTSMVAKGHNAAILFCVQHTGINSVTVAERVDPKYAELMRKALKEGVKVYAYKCNITKFDISIDERIPFVI